MSNGMLGDVSGEYADSDFGDSRLDRRLVQLASSLSVEPDASFPVAAGSDATLEATYRFLNNEKVKPGVVLAPHVRATVVRARSEEHTSELQSRRDLVCRLLLEKKKKKRQQ